MDIRPFIMNTLYGYINEVSNILGICINHTNSICLYEDVTSHVYNDVCTESFHEKILNINGSIHFKRYVERRGRIEELEYTEICTIQDVNNIFTRFIKDSYYDSPILFGGLHKIDEPMSEFTRIYLKHPTYFYMGKYGNDTSTEYTRIYVRRNTEECYNEYITE